MQSEALQPVREWDGVQRMYRVGESRFVVVSEYGVVHYGAWPERSGARRFAASMHSDARPVEVEAYFYAGFCGPVRMVDGEWVAISREECAEMDARIVGEYVELPFGERNARIVEVM